MLSYRKNNIKFMDDNVKFMLIKPFYIIHPQEWLLTDIIIFVINKNKL